MNLATPCTISQRDGVTWITVTVEQWFAMHQELKDLGHSRFEWLTAVHQGEDSFLVYSRVNDFIITTQIASATSIQLPSVTSIFRIADFHERETRQMFGLEFIGGSTEPAFNCDFSGFPLRRDFALASRQSIAWPGAVEPSSENSSAQPRRRPQLPPGIFPEWGSDD